jgi:hypothetical protein
MHFMTTIGIILLVAYEIKKDGMTRAERRAYKRMLVKQKKGQ